LGPGRVATVGGAASSGNAVGRGTVAGVTVPATSFIVGPRATTGDGVKIATYDFGGDGPPLLFSHATGFHGRVWLPVAAHLRDHFHCFAFDARGHGESAKAPHGRSDWGSVARDALAVVDELDLAPVRAVGHSFGGTVLLLAEQSRPGTFHALYCYEPVLLVDNAPPVPADDTIQAPRSPNATASGARRRREVFASREAAYANYIGKPPFSSFDPSAVHAYVDYGFDDLADGRVRLRCRGEDEARVYEMAAHHDALERMGEIGCPVTVVCGAEFPHFGPEVIAHMAALLPRSTTEVLPGLGHFGPMERPAEVAASILRAFDTGVSRSPQDTAATGSAAS
jgi:pimeloyl-ACP methyl ester carboxylesterase